MIGQSAMAQNPFAILQMTPDVAVVHRMQVDHQECESQEPHDDDVACPQAPSKMPLLLVAGQGRHFRVRLNAAAIRKDWDGKG
jgi:hypothetical protein